jgi:hypothetical protein
MPLGDDFVYPDPRSPGHVRDVLRSIQRRNADTTALINALTTRVAALEALVPVETFTFDSTATDGQPVYISGSGSVDLADASALSTAGVVGLVTNGGAAATNSGDVDVDPDVVELTDWSSVTGSSTLTPGALYYLSTTAGELTETPPSGDGEVIVPVGRAISTTELEVEIGQSILL